MRICPQCAWFFSALLLMAASCTSDSDNTYEKTSRKTLAEILEDAEFSITENNLRVVDRLHIGESIRSRGNKQFPDYEIILYCNLTFAEKILSLAPDLINACPGRVTVRGKTNSYVVSAPLWPEHNDNAELNRLMHEMNGTVRAIVDFAAADWIESSGE